MYNLHKYGNLKNMNVFNYISNKQIITYFIISIILLLIVKYVNNFSYTFIFICLFGIFVYYSQTISTTNEMFKIKQKTYFLKQLNINSLSLIARDDELLKILYDAIFIKIKTPYEYNKMVKRIENFFVIYETLKQNISNINLMSTDMIRPFTLESNHHSILINDLRDQIELIIKHIQTMIHVLPNELIYLNAFYQFSQIIKSHLSRYYNRILSDYNYYDHTSQYLLIRSSENKYNFLD